MGLFAIQENKIPTQTMEFPSKSKSGTHHLHHLLDLVFLPHILRRLQIFGMQETPQDEKITVKYLVECSHCDT